MESSEDFRVIDGHRILAVIPARGGSKGVPGKNIRVVGGRPLIGWTIAAAHASTLIDRVVLSSDDPEIIGIAKGLNCEVPFVRSPTLADDRTPTIDVVLDALERCKGYEWVVLLQPTSPLRIAQDIDDAIRYCFNNRSPSCVSVCRVEQSPYWMYTMMEDGHLNPLLPFSNITRRQDLPAVYIPNGAIYVANADWIKRHRLFVTPETLGFEMPFERSLDIDSEADLFQLQFLLGETSNVSLSPTP